MSVVNLYIVLVTLEVTERKYPILKVKSGKVYFSPQFVEVSVHTQLVPRQGGTRQKGITEKTELMVWCQEAEKDQRRGGTGTLQGLALSDSPPQTKLYLPKSHLATNLLVD